MRILIYGLNFSPELTGIGKYTGEMATWLADHGHEVRVVTAPPYYPAWRVEQGFKAWRYRRERIGTHMTVFRCPLWVPAHPTGVTRILHLISFALTSFPVALMQANWNPDVVFTVEPTFFSAPLAWVVANLSNAASWLHVQDFEVDAAFELNLLPARGPVHWFAVRAEEWFTSHFHLVSSISPKMVERSMLKGVPADKAALFPNWGDVQTICPMAPDTEYRRELGLTNATVVLYSGNMGGKQGLEVLAPLVRACADDPSIQFVFCGNGVYLPLLEREMAGLSNVRLLPLQPKDRLNELLNTADIHLLPQRSDASDLVMPSKLAGMLATGRPVVATAHEGTQVAMSVQDRGIVVEPDDIDSLVAAVRTLAADRSLRERLGREARRYAEETLEQERILQQFERDLERVSHARRTRRGKPRRP